MSVASLAIGDIIEPYVVQGGDYGDTPTIEQNAYEIECRIDTLSTGQSRVARRADSELSHRSYHATDPELRTGMLVKWTKTGVRAGCCDAIEFDPVPILRVMGVGTEGRPGQPPKLWWVEYRQLTAEQLGDLADET